MEDKSIQKGLEQDAQIIRERIPMDITQANADKIAESLRLFMAENDYSGADIGRMIGMTSGVISQFLNGKYKHNLEELINKIVNLVNSVESRGRKPRGPTFVETTVARKIGTLIANTDAFSREEGKIGIIIGDSGCGKSRCLQAYAEANQNSLYVQLDKRMYSTMIFTEIANHKRLHLNITGSLAVVTQHLIEHLENRHITIILDEASSLNVSQLDLLRQIISVKSRCPLILAGNEALLNTIMLPTVRRGFESLDQFRSRLMSILDLNALSSEGGGGLYTAEDIQKLYQYGGIRLHSDAISLLRKICNTAGSSRLWFCTCVIGAIHTAKDIQEKGIDAKCIRAAVKQLNLPDRWLPMVVREAEKEDEQKRVAKSA